MELVRTAYLQLARTSELDLLNLGCVGLLRKPEESRSLVRYRHRGDHRLEDLVSIIRLSRCRTGRERRDEQRHHTGAGSYSRDHRSFSSVGHAAFFLPFDRVHNQFGPRFRQTASGRAEARPCAISSWQTPRCTDARLRRFLPAPWGPFRRRCGRGGVGRCSTTRGRDVGLPLTQHRVEPACQRPGVDTVPGGCSLHRWSGHYRSPGQRRSRTTRFRRRCHRQLFLRGKTLPPE